MALDVYKEWLGIPEGPRPPDHYALLRLKQFDDEVDRIRANYKKLNAHVRRYATGQYLDESQALLNELAKAMLCLTDHDRKREYDESQGREFAAEEAGPRTMDQVLVSQKHVTRDQAREAVEYAERSGLEVRDAFVQLKLVSSDVATQALAQELGLSYVDLSDVTPDDAVLDQVPRKVVRQYSVLPLFLDAGTLLVACVHQIDHVVEDELRLRFDGAAIRTVLVAKSALDEAIARYYAPGLRQEPGVKTAARSPVPGEKAADGKTRSQEKPAAPQPAPRAAPKRIEPRSEEQLKQNRQIFIIVLCWSVVAAYLLDNFVVTPRVFLDMWSFLLFLGLPALVAAIAGPLLLKR